jgi:hypothetical protein
LIEIPNVPVGTKLSRWCPPNKQIFEKGTIFFGHHVDRVVCAPDDEWKYHPKHVEQFPDINNCVSLHLIGYTSVLEYYEELTLFSTLAG